METPPSACPCLNCSHPLPDDAAFCPACGQKNSDGKISLLELISDFFSHLFNLDLTIFPTLKAFFVPGKLTKEYFAGRQKQYISPIRLFLFSILLLIAILNAHFSFETGQLPTDPVNVAKTVYHKQSVVMADSARKAVLARFPQLACHPLLDSHQVIFRQLMQADTLADDSLGISLDIALGGQQIRPRKIARADYLKKTPEELVATNKSLSTLEKIFYEQVLKSLKESKGFAKYLVGRILWLALLLIPAHALFFKLLLFRRKRYFVEHLVFQYHAHAFLFLLLSLYFLFEESLPGETLLVMLAAFGIYVLLALKSVYELHWVWAITLFFLLHTIYIFLAISILLLVLIAGFFLF